ncbi:MAG: TIGR01841 family phasin [Pseudomonadota bacterium]
MDSQAQNELTKLSMALLQVQRDWWTEASSKASDSGRRLAELNMNTMKDSLAQTTAAMQDLAAAKDPQQWMAIANAQFQPRLERALSYSRQWVDIASSFQAQMSQIAQSEVTEATEKTSALIDGLVSSMPEEAKPTVAMMKTVIDGAKVSYEQLTKTTQQMAEALDAGRIAAMKQASEASHKMSTGKTKHH